VANGQGISIIAKGDINTTATITAIDSNVYLTADYDLDNVGEFHQDAGVISATGYGNVYLDGSNTMKLGTISTEYGSIKVGTIVTPTIISGTPEYIHTKGDFEITNKSTTDYTMTLQTTRGDVLKYNTTGGVTLEAPLGSIRDLTDTTLPADYLKIAAIDVSVKSSAVTTEIYMPTGDIIITSSTPVGEDMINISGEHINLTYFRANNVTLRSDNTVATAEGVILNANTFKVIARQFGTSDIPLYIDANRTHIQSLTDINIMQSTGIGTSVMITGPPEDNFKIIYSRSTDLILEAGRISVSPTTESISLYGNITFSNLYCTIPGLTIHFEAGKTYTVLNTLHIIGAESPDGSIANRIKLISTMPGERWYIDPRGDHEVSSLDVRDSYNLDPRLIIGLNIEHDANSYNWDLTRYWVGKDTTNPTYWNDTDNWSTGSGGSGGATVPAAGDAVIFDAGSADKACLVNAATANLLSFTISSYNGTITASNNVTVSGTFSQSSGTFNLSATLSATTLSLSGGTLSALSGNMDIGTGGVSITGTGVLTPPGDGKAFYIGGGLYITTGTASAAEGIITFDGSSSVNITTAEEIFFNMSFTGSGTWTMQDPLTMTGMFYQSGGSFSNGSSTLTVGMFNQAGGTFNHGADTTIAINGSATFSGTFNKATGGSNTAIIIFDTDADVDANGKDLGNIQIGDNSGGGSTTTLTDSIEVDNITISSYSKAGEVNTLSAGTNTITVNGNWTLGTNASWTESSSFTYGTSTVVFDGTSTQTIGGVASTTFYNLTVSPSSGNVVELNAATTLASGGRLTIDSGAIFDINGKDFTITTAANFTNNGTFRLTGSESVVNINMGTPTGTVEYDGTGTSGFKLGNSYYSLKLSGTGTWTPSSNLLIDGTLTNANTLNIGGYTLQINRGLSNSGTITTTGNGSNLIIDSSITSISGTVSFTSSAASSLPKKTYSTLNLANGGTVSGGTVTASTLNVTAGTLTIGSASASGTLSITSTANIDGVLEFNTAGGTSNLDINNATITYSGATLDFTNCDSFLTDGSSIFAFDGTTALTSVTNISDFDIVRVNNGGTLTLYGDTFHSYTLIIGQGVSGVLNNNGVQLYGYTQITIDTGATLNLSGDFSGGGPVWCEDFTSRGTINYLTAGEAAIRIGGSGTFSGVFDTDIDIVMQSAQGESIDSSIPLGKLVIWHTSSGTDTQISGHALTVSDLTLGHQITIPGILNTNGYKLTVNGDIDITYPGSRLTVQSSTLDANDDIDIQSGCTLEFTGIGSTLELKGDLTNSGTLTLNSATVTFNSEAPSTQIINSGGVQFANVVFASTTTVYYDNGMSIGGTTTISQDTNIRDYLDNGSITFTGAVNADSAANNRSLTIDADAGAVDFLSTIGATQALGTLTVTAGTSHFHNTVTTRSGGITVSSPTQIRFDGAVSTAGTSTAGTLNVTGPVTLGGNVTITTDSTTDSNINFIGSTSTINGAYTLGLNAGSGGSITLGGAVGGSTTLTGLTITNSNGTTFSSTVRATTLTLTDTTDGQDIIFNGAVTLGTLTTAAQGYDIALNAGGTITNDTNFLNTGSVTLGNGGDTLTFTGGLSTTACAGGTNIGGTVRTAGQQIDLGAITLTGSSTVDSSNNGGSATGAAINISSITGGSNVLTLISRTGTTTVSGAVSGVATLTLHDDNANSTGSMIFNGTLSASTLTTVGRGYSVQLNGDTTITNDTNFLNTGSVTLGNGGDTLTFTGGLSTTACAGGTNIGG
ncbi:MAG: hypothetical protein KBB52_02005, partial [Candidatus Omnitrophica bacterium]|nr:hypothetical protein [Candidatus Omnitrophota bacterium]